MKEDVEHSSLDSDGKMASLGPWASGSHPPHRIAEPLSGLHLDMNGRYSIEPTESDEGMASFIADDKISEIFLAAFGELISATELRLLKFLMAGSSLREMSERDNVSYETRRNQFKSIQSKTGIKKQSELMVRMSSLIALHTNHSTEKVEGPAEMFKVHLLGNWHGPYRAYPWYSDKGTSLLVGELGPIDGRPVLMLHSGFHPVFPLPSSSNLLSEHGIRLIIPFRTGFFGTPTEKSQPDLRLGQYLNNLSEFLLAYRLTNVPILAFNQGVEAALCLVSQGKINPQSVLAISPNFAKSGKLPNVSFAVRMAVKVAKSAPASAALFFRAALVAAKSGRGIASGLVQYFGRSDSDRKEIVKSVHDNRDMHFLQTAMLDSLPGFVNDLAEVTRGWPDLDPDSARSLKFMFSEQEAFSNLDAFFDDDVYGLADRIIVPDCGRMGLVMRPEIILTQLDLMMNSRHSNFI